MQGNTIHTFQDVLLTRIPKYMIKIIAPGKESLLDSSLAKAARIGLTAALFSSLHFRNLQSHSQAEVVSQVVCTFVLGLGFGMIKESKAGILGAIGAHMANNALAAVPIYFDC